MSKEELATFSNTMRRRVALSRVKNFLAEIANYRQTWAFVFGKFMTDGVWWFFLFWLPKYLEVQYKMQKTDIVMPLTVLYSMTMVGSIGGGYLPAIS
jgi:nitrate/nitrite transporter NarK